MFSICSSLDSPRWNGEGHSMSEEITIPTASQSEAEAGIVADKAMTPLRTKQAIDAQTVSFDVLASSAGAEMVGVRNGRRQADKNAEGPSIFDVIPPVEHAAILAGTSTYDATDDFNQVFAEMDGTGLTLLVPGGTYRVRELTIAGSNFKINSQGAWLHQMPGLRVDDNIHPILSVLPAAHDVDIGNWYLRGNIDADATAMPGIDGYMHGIAIVSAKNITVGDIYGEDILGDLLYTYGRNTSEAEMIRNLRVGVVRGSNIYRCIVALVGAECRIEGIVQEGPVGFRDLDVEPNDAFGTYQAVEADIGFVTGSQVSIISADPDVINKSVRIGTLDLDGSRLANSSAPYPSYQGVGAIALALMNCDTTSIAEMRLRNYASYPVNMTSNWRELSIGSLDFANCGAADNTLKGIFVQRALDQHMNELPPPEGAVLRIGKVTGRLESSNVAWPGSAGRRLVASFNGQIRVEIGAAKVSNGMIASGVTGRIDIDGEWDFGEGYNEIAILGCKKLIVTGMKAVNCVSTYGLYGSDEITFIGCEGEFGAGFDYTNISTNIVSIGNAITGAAGVNIANGEIRINGTKVLGARGAAIADASIAVANPTKAEFDALVGTVNAILARARAATPSIAT